MFACGIGGRYSGAIFRSRQKEAPMPVELSATKTIDMIERLYQKRTTVSKEDVVAEARRSDLGGDGLLIVETLEPGDYDKGELTAAISDILLSEGGRGT
jgi:hypothetical protein